MIVNYAARVIQIKILLFGGDNAERDAIFRLIMAKYNNESSESDVSVISCGMLHISGLDWNIKVLLTKCDPKEFYATTRPSVFDLTDGIIFISSTDADMDKKRLSELNLYGERLCNLPIAFTVDAKSGDTYDIEKILDMKSFNKAKIFCDAVDSFRFAMQSLFPSITIP